MSGTSTAARSQQLARMRADEDFLALTDARVDALRRADSAAEERLAIAQAYGKMDWTASIPTGQLRRRVFAVELGRRLRNPAWF